jgi:rRNA-processing protein EBP2
MSNIVAERQETSGDLGANEADLFDVGVDNELNAHAAKKAFSRGQDGERGGPNTKRQKKDAKFGFGGKKRHAKSGDAVSTGDMSGFSAKRMKTGAKGKVFKTARLGKNKRKTAVGKR